MIAIQYRCEVWPDSKGGGGVVFQVYKQAGSNGDWDFHTPVLNIKGKQVPAINDKLIRLPGRNTVLAGETPSRHLSKLTDAYEYQEKILKSLQYWAKHFPGFNNHPENKPFPKDLPETTVVLEVGGEKRLAYELIQRGRSVFLFVHWMDERFRGKASNSEVPAYDKPGSIRIVSIHAPMLDVNSRCIHLWGSNQDEDQWGHPSKFNTVDEATEFTTQAHATLKDWSVNWPGWKPDTEIKTTIEGSIYTIERVER